MRWTSLQRIVLTILVGIGITGCYSPGPKALERTRGDYNTAINQTEMEQLLLNIVRLRFTDNPYFLQVSSVTTRPSGKGRLGVNRGDVDSFIEFGQNPTIVYQPLAGKQFVRSLLTRIDANTLFMLAGAGWELDDIMEVFVNRLNGLPNAPIGTGPTPEGVPEYKEFQTVVDAFDALEDQGALILASTGDEESQSLVLTIDRNSADAQSVRRFQDLLGLNPDLSRYQVHIGIGSGGDRRINIETRPILAAMYFLGQNTQVPAEWQKDGTVHMHRDDSGKLYDWNVIYGNLFRVRSSPSRPAAYPAVEYLGHWFYIDPKDIQSRETLTMLGAVFSLQASVSSSSGPVLTLPID